MAGSNRDVETPRPDQTDKATSRFDRVYGAGPLQLVVLLGCFALFGWVALQVHRGPSQVRIAVWFVGAALAHDLVLFPIYALADRSVASLTSRAPRRARLPLPALNHLRVPALLSLLLLLMFFPLVLDRGGPAYNNASGLDRDAYVGRYLAVVAVLFGGSVLLYVARLLRRQRSGTTVTASDAQPHTRARPTSRKVR